MKPLLVTVLVSISLLAFSQAKYDTIPNTPVEEYNLKINKFRKEPVVTGKVLFAGDDYVNWRKLLKDSSVINRSITGENTFGMLLRASEIARHKPASVFLLVGINDLSKNVPMDRIIENIFSIVHTINKQSPGTKVFVQSLLPVNATVPTFQKQFSRKETIGEINDQLRKYGKIVKYTFVDIHPVFSSKGNLDTRYTKDGVHLNAAGVLAWIDYLKKNHYL